MEKEIISTILESAGITINGHNPWDIREHDSRMYRSIISDHSLGLGESYMKGWWSSSALDQMFEKLLTAKLDIKVKRPKRFILALLRARLINLQSVARASEVVEKHYNLGNNLYQSMLDSGMNYSCGYWENTNDLDTAQKQKLDLICRKLFLEKGMKVLDIGCGWGGFAQYAAQHYGVHVMGITISEEQKKRAQTVCQDLPVSIKLQDYRHVEGQFDRVVSIGMFEHVGPKNYKTYMKKVYQCLKPDGLFLLHTIGNQNLSGKSDPWIQKYIFPNGVLPTPRQICAACETTLILQDWHNFGHDYDKTLMAWHANFKRNWDDLKEQYSPEFFRMWSYYLLSFAAAFRIGRLNLWQIVFSKAGNISPYKSIR